MRKKVYLAGTTKPFDESDWRLEAASIMDRNFNLQPLDPLDWECWEPTDAEIVGRDTYLVYNSDALLVDGRTPSWGAAMEVEIAHSLGIPVVVWGISRSTCSPWLAYHAIHVEVGMIEAIEYLAELLV